MQKLTFDLVVGVVVGTTTTFILFILKEFWTNTIRPQIEKILYKDIRFNGEWEVIAYFDPPRTRKMYLQQQAHRITGELISTEKSDIPSKWLLKGEVKNLIVTLTFASSLAHSRGRGTITLITRNGGERLDGYCAYLSTGKDKEYDDIDYVKYECQFLSVRPSQG